MGRHPMATSISRSRRVQICRTGVDPTRRSNRLQQAVKGSIASHHVRAPVQQSLAKLRSCPSFRCACMTLRTITHSTVGPGPCIAAAGHTVRGAWLHAWRVCWAPRRADTVPQTSQSDSLVQAHRHSRLQRSEADQARTNRPRKVSLSSSCMLKEIWQRAIECSSTTRTPKCGQTRTRWAALRDPWLHGPAPWACRTIYFCGVTVRPPEAARNRVLRLRATHDRTGDSARCVPTWSCTSVLTATPGSPRRTT